MNTHLPARFLLTLALLCLPIAALPQAPESVDPQVTDSVTIPDVQGEGHRSPKVGQTVTVDGIVTATLPLRIDAQGDDAQGDEQPTPRGFWLQSADDGNMATSEGVYVTCEVACTVSVGLPVRVTGEVREPERDGQLPVTQIAATGVEVLSTQRVQLPVVVELGPGTADPEDARRRAVPGPVIDDDGLTRFEPAGDALDFYESLEGMRVRVPDPVVVGPTNSYGEIVVLPSGGAGIGNRSARGGVVLTVNDLNPERLIVNIDALLPRDYPVPQASVGDRFDGAIIGVLSYDYGTYRLLPTEPLPLLIPYGMKAPDSSEPVADGPVADNPVADAPAPEAGSILRGDDEHITIATYNVLNLDAKDPDTQFRRLAAQIAGPMASPDILALQEVQDDNGAEPGPWTSPNQTLKKLIFAIRSAGGPRYEYRQIDPLPNADGGQPDGNIRVVYLFNPERVAFLDRGEAGASDAVEIDPGTGGGELSLTLSPGRIEPEHSSFGPDPDSDALPSAESGSRKSLAAEFRIGHGATAQRLFLINNHLTSKRGDDRDFGSRQPPVRHSEKRRLEQTQVIGNFVSELLNVDPEAWIVVLGDMNEHEFRAPIRHLVDEVGLVNLMETVPLAQRYTYNYQGNSQVLDHILISTTLAKKAQPQLEIVHVNADFPSNLQASDHEPVILRLHTH